MGDVSGLLPPTKIAFGSGQSVVVPFMFTSPLRTGKGEKGEGALIPTSDVGGSAGANATLCRRFQGHRAPRLSSTITPPSRAERKEHR